jgi:hypothetical protein
MQNIASLPDRELPENEEGDDDEHCPKIRADELVPGFAECEAA